jgi:hypothetical protein
MVVVQYQVKVLDQCSPIVRLTDRFEIHRQRGPNLTILLIVM